MSNLVIDHGNPAWLSPNVWAVPTSNPNEPSPGVVSPFVDNKYYLVANVRNTSTFDVLNAAVYFWWATPSTAILTSANAHFIGTSSVSVVGGGSNTALTLKTWTPSYTGHECLVAAVVEGGGPPPTILDAAKDPTVACHNLWVHEIIHQPHSGGQRMDHFSCPIQICNQSRIEQRFTIHAERAPIEIAAPFLHSIHKKTKQPSEHIGKGTLKLGFVREVCPNPSSIDYAKHVLEDVKLAPFSCTGVTLVGVLEGGDQALIHVTQRLEERVVGGLSVLILSNREQRHDRS